MPLTIPNLQRALVALGYDLGPSGADGVFGRRTQAAVAQFQSDNGIKVRWPGTVGPATEVELIYQLGRQTGGGKLLTSGERNDVRVPWLAEAERLKGVREVAGAANNPVILGWAKRLGGWVASYYREDATPWCGLFVAHCIGLTLPDEALPTNPLSALAWAKFGRATTPAPGAILVFQRPGGGHVGLYVGEDAAAYQVLGGNQSDSVNVTRVAKDRHVATRWPATAAAPTGGRVTRAAGTPLSTNEA